MKDIKIIISIKDNDSNSVTEFKGKLDGTNINYIDSDYVVDIMIDNGNVNMKRVGNEYSNEFSLIKNTITKMVCIVDNNRLEFDLNTIKLDIKDNRIEFIYQILANDDIINTINFFLEYEVI